MKLIEPRTKIEFEAYYDLRWRILRKPWELQKGSEKDELDKSSYHLMVLDESTGEVSAVGRLQINSNDEAQIRYMAVADRYQGQGLGSKIVEELEKIALKKEVQSVILQARKNAVKFYEKNGYNIVEKSYVLFDEIQHWLMRKEIE